MRHGRFVGYLAALLSVCGVTIADSQERELVTLTEDLKVERLTDNVWRHISYDEVEGFGRVPGNGLLVISGAAAALIDTPWTDDQTRRLFRWASERHSATITTVIATHSHADCMGGLAAAHQLGASSYASAKTAEIARQDGKQVPQTTFTDELEVEVGSRKLKLHAAGPGHTVDNIVVWIPNDQILFGGCLVRSNQAKSLGFTGEADLKGWPRTIKSLLREYRDAQWVVPGHGAPGTTDMLRHTRTLLESE